MKTHHLPSFLFLLSVLFIFQNCSTEQNSKKTNISNTISENVAPILGKQIVAPPIEGIDVGFKTFTVLNNESKTITLKNGSSIEIPANAFMGKNDQPLTTPVDIKYREFHSAGDIIASGIPMKAAHNGETGYMESAGMFEILAYSNHQEVFIANGKEIQVNMASNVPGDNFDFWHFDAEKGNWDNLGRSTPKVNTLKREAKKVLASLSNMVVPLKPVEFDKKRPVLNFDINVEAYPELKEMDGVFWQYTGKGENPESAKWIFDEEWDHADIERTDRANEYQLVLTKGKKKFKTSVCPSQKGEGFEEAMANYSSKMKDYKNNSSTKKQKEEFVRQQADLIRSFKINGMGIHNYDILWKDDKNILVKADFDFGKDVPSAHRKVNVYLVSNNGRSVVAYPFADRKKFGFDPRVENQIIAILPNNKIATFSPDDFEANKALLESAKGNNYTFKMKVKENEIKNIDDINSLLADINNQDLTPSI